MIDPIYTNPGGIPYFNESLNMSPWKAGKILMKVANAHAKGNHTIKGGKGKGKSRGDRFMLRGPSMKGGKK